MRTRVVLLLALLCGAAGSCSSKPPSAPFLGSRLEVFVHWQDQGLEHRRLEILELGWVRETNGDGIAEFHLPAGRYTLRAFVNSGGLPGWTDLDILTRRGETTRVEVADCLPCVEP